jgi:hypothetical protein
VGREINLSEATKGEEQKYEIMLELPEEIAAPSYDEGETKIS